MSNAELTGNIPAREVIAMTALGLHLARARNDSDYQKSGALRATMRDPLEPTQQRCQQRGPATYDLLPQPPPGRGSANLSRLSGEASHQNRRASPTAGPRVRTVPPCESVEARCQKRVHGAGAICAYEEEVPRSRHLAQERFLSGNPELGSIRSPYHQFKERLFRQYWSRCDIDVGNHAMTGTIGWLTNSAGAVLSESAAGRSLDKKTDHDRNQLRSRRRPRDWRQNQCLMYSGGADALCREASLLAGIEASCPDRQRQRPRVSWRALSRSRSR